MLSARAPSMSTTPPSSMTLTPWSLAVAHVHLELDEGAVHQDTGGLRGLVLQVAGGQVDTGQEDIVLHSVYDLNTDQVAVLVQPRYSEQEADHRQQRLCHC